MPERFLDPYRLIQGKLGSIWNSFFEQLPNLAGALIFLLLAWLVTRLARRWIVAATQQRGRDDLGGLLSSVVTMGVMTFAALVSAAIIFPSVSPSTVLSTLGIGSVAIGFAFRDILQNLFAGILIVVNRPFRRGDVIAVEGYEGTVQRVEARATIIKTADGRRIAMPNSVLYTSPVTINTANSSRRDEFELVLAPGQTIERIFAAIEDAVAQVDGVLDQPPPAIVSQGLAGDGLHVLVRWWTPARGISRQTIHSDVVGAVALAIEAHRVVLSEVLPPQKRAA